QVELEHAALLLSIIGLVSLASRPAAGLLLGLPCLRRGGGGGGGGGCSAYMLGGMVVVNGLSNSLCGAWASFPSLVLYAVVFGLSQGFVGSLIFTVLMELLEPDDFQPALGLVSLLQGAALLAGPPLAGMLVDATGQYSYVFHACNAAVTSGVESEDDRSAVQPDSPAAPDPMSAHRSTHLLRLWSSTALRSAGGLPRGPQLTWRTCSHTALRSAGGLPRGPQLTWRTCSHTALRSAGGLPRGPQLTWRTGSHPHWPLACRSLHVDGPPHVPSVTTSYVHGTSSTSLRSATVGRCLQETARRWPHREAVDKAAAGLLALGLSRGDRLGVWGPNSYEWILFLYATAKAGIIMVSVNPAYQPKELEYALRKVCPVQGGGLSDPL
ncbi:hypothetical protein CRUP_001901, partial [Coryphaenoides rupestris]